MPAVLGHDHDVGDGAVEVAEIVKEVTLSVTVHSILSSEPRAWKNGKNGNPNPTMRTPGSGVKFYGVCVCVFCTFSLAPPTKKLSSAKKD